jgi:hypothetical protein
MAHHPATPTPASGFRQPFPLELSPEEYEVLEAAGRSAGSKRAALLAGLAALEDATRLRADAARTATAHNEAQATIAALDAKIGELERIRDAANEKAKTGAARGRRAADAARVQSTRDAQWADEAREAERETRLDVQAELDELDALFVDELRCPRCGKFAPRDEWATERTKEGRLVYNGPCGYHRCGLLDETSVLGRRPVR